MEYEIQTHNLGKKYGTYWAIQGVNLNIPRGKIYGLLGRNGAGKTTIMKLILGLAEKTEGEIELFQKKIINYSKEIYTRIGSMIESPGFYPNITGRENLEIFARLRGSVDKKKIKKALDIVGLSYEEKKLFQNYSLGMKQRLSIANAIMNNPDILILDEPTNGLDPIGILEVRKLIKNLSEEYGKTILISSHQLSEMEQLVDYIGIIHEGNLLEECSYQALREREHPYIRLIAEQPVKVYQYLDEYFKIENMEIINTGEIYIYNSVYSTLEINRSLFEANLGVSEISMCRDNLEDYFRELTGGVGIA